MIFIPVMSMLLTENPALRLDLSLMPRVWAEKTKSELTATLVNTSGKPVTALVGTAADPHFFFRVHLQEVGGAVISTGREPRNMDMDDLPMPVFQTIAPGASHRVEVEWRSLYNLRPGKYTLSVVYRVMPEEKTDAVRLYVRDIQKNQAFTGIVESESVQFTVEVKK